MIYANLAAKEIVDTTVSNLTAKSIHAVVVPNKTATLEEIKKLIPQGASVMNGSSVTLEQIGFVEYLASGTHRWNDLHAAITAENDKEKRAELRKQSVLSDYYLGSVHALTQQGEMIIASNTGSQLPHIVFTSPNLIFVISTKKIVPDLAEGMKRLEEHVIPLEDEHMKQKYGFGTTLNKIVIFKNENQNMGRKIHVLLVEEDLGF